MTDENAEEMTTSAETDEGERAESERAESERAESERAESERATESHGKWWHRATAVAMAILLGLGVLWAIQLFAWLLALLVGGIAIAAALAPVVDRLANYIPRAIAVILVYIILVLIFVGLGWLALPPIFTQAQQVVEQLPQMVESAQQWLNNWIMLDDGSLMDIATTALQSVSTAIVSFPQRIARVTVHSVVIIFLSIYLLILAPATIEFMLSLVPRAQQSPLERVISRMGNAMGGYVRGVFIDSVLVGIVTYIGLLLIGLDFPLVLAVISGVLEIIPVLGPVIAGAIMVGVALAQAPDLALIVLIFALVLQQVESNIIVPNIMKGQAKVSPVLTILALLAGERLGGVIGALVAIPLVAALRVFVVDVIAPAIRRRTGASS